MENIKSKFKKTNESLRSSNRVTFVVIITSLLYLVLFSFHFVLGLIREKDIVWFDFPGKDEGVILIFIQTLIFAPLFETLLNQTLPYYLLNKVKYLNERSYLILLSSALFFGLEHFYSLFYILYGFLMGLVFMYGYMVRIKSDKKTFYLIAICHFLVNLGLFIRNLLVNAFS
ncbi:MAG: CPBP family glutamic-type intramembrane protease [Bacteroidota bacterium]